MESTSPARNNLESDPAAYLPHRAPFLFVDSILSLDSGRQASGVKCVTHETSQYPGVFLLESMAQLGGIAAAEKVGEGGFLAAVDRARFHRPVQPGDRIMISVRIVKTFGRLYLLEGEARVDDQLLATADLTLGIGML
ncbi:MAG: hotdog domain-containing protein [Geobacteraceae bacterium]|nr:hotdog domain-containing protein [Geobacteraceae bacterium]